MTAVYGDYTKKYPVIQKGIIAIYYRNNCF